MDLKTFVSSTLAEIAQGVAEAQVPIANCGGILNPINTAAPTSDNNIRVTNAEGDSLTVREVKFDVAVTASEETEKKTGGGVKVLTAKLDGDLTSTNSSRSISRITFSVNLALPHSSADESHQNRPPRSRVAVSS
ncbi:hypothetical protein [Halodesulfovibrio sp.]|uniref:hypothetical protein n=1 Tax=Halodesulfovibrio sp. TaxID=1912772 RepID=UPI0025FD3C4C|nr:hypothetical protein [Halodesulfovibrio sp.]MCT4534966.1 hypothetical protein [Halodesulfovibrio sp.]